MDLSYVLRRFILPDLCQRWVHRDWMEIATVCMTLELVSKETCSTVRRWMSDWPHYGPPYAYIKFVYARLGHRFAGLLIQGAREAGATFGGMSMAHFICPNPPPLCICVEMIVNPPLATLTFIRKHDGMCRITDRSCNGSPVVNMIQPLLDLATPESIYHVQCDYSPFYDLTDTKLRAVTFRIHPPQKYKHLLSYALHINLPMDDMVATFSSSMLKYVLDYQWTFNGYVFTPPPCPLAPNEIHLCPPRNWPVYTGMQPVYLTDYVMWYCREVHDEHDPEDDENCGFMNFLSSIDNAKVVHVGSLAVMRE